MNDVLSSVVLVRKSIKTFSKCFDSCDQWIWNKAETLETILSSGIEIVSNIHPISPRLVCHLKISIWLKHDLLNRKWEKVEWWKITPSFHPNSLIKILYHSFITLRSLYGDISIQNISAWIIFIHAIPILVLALQ